MKNQTLTSLFMRGLFATMPVVATLYLMYWLFNLVDQFIKGLLPPEAQFPGIGWLILILLIFSVGLLVSTPMTNTFYRYLEMPFRKLPFLKVFYSAIQDFMNYFKKEGKDKPNQVVVVSPGPGQWRLVGLLTRENPEGVPNDLSKDGYVAVYMPMSYQLGGFTSFVPRAWVTPIDLRMETAMKNTLTAWMLKQEEPS